jgi:hypothetical protein
MAVPPDQIQAPGYEIAARLVKVLLFGLTGLMWVFVAFGAYSVYALWTADKASEWLQSNLRSSLEFGWLAIGAIVVTRLVQIAIGWAVLAPIEAKIQGINLRDPEVAKEIRTTTSLNLVFELTSLVIYIAVPLAVAHFRFRYFS